MTKSLESLSGHIDRITFHNEENGFCVLKARVHGQKDLVTVIGNCATVSAGEWFEAQGHWISDKTYGPQFKTETLSLILPTTLEGIEKYLGSGLIKGVGPVYAKKMVQTFGQNIFTIIEETPQKLSFISGLGPSRIQKIKSGWEDQKIIREIMLFLHSHEVGTAKSVRIYKTYGQQSLAIIQENPYRLAQDIRGIGFVSADKIARQMGIDASSLIRARAGISHGLAKAMDKGHCCLPKDELIQTCHELLTIDPLIIQQALELEIDQGNVIKTTIDGTLFMGLKGLWNAESGIAERLRCLGQYPHPWPVIDSQSALNALETQEGVRLSQSQQEAFQMVLANKITIITGGPGVGKTTLLRSLIHTLRQQKLNMALCAPTGRAAKRMSEATGFEAKTIHRLLNINPMTGSFSFNEYCPLITDVVIVDETSMVDVSLMYALLKAIPDHAGLIMVGDKDQLPSVGPGQVLCDMIYSHTIPVVHLQETFRQAASSIIIKVAQEINQETMPALKGYGSTSDFFFLESYSLEQTMATVVDLIHRRLPDKYGYSPVQDIQILCPMTRGVVGTHHLNKELQHVLNPTPSHTITKFGTTFGVGDKVMQIENNYQKEVYNGDIGLIHKIDEGEGELLINFDGKDIIYDAQELDEIIHAYAMTIHKSQGSEYPVVIIPMVMQHAIMLQKNLIYTGITRGKKLVILVGQPQAISTCVRQKRSTRRWTILAHWLSKALAS